MEHEEGAQAITGLSSLLAQSQAWAASYVEPSAELEGLALAAEEKETSRPEPDAPVQAQEALLAEAEHEGQLEEEVVDALAFWWPSLKRPDQTQFWMALHACGQVLQEAGHDGGLIFLKAAQARTLDAQAVEALDGLKGRLTTTLELSPPTLVRLLKANLEMAQSALTQQTPRSFWRLMAEHAALLAEAEGHLEAETR